MAMAREHVTIPGIRPTNRSTVRALILLMILVLAALLVVGFPSVPQAQNGTPQNAVETVISSQLEAFRSGDKIGAYAHAAPIIQQRFGNPDSFMQMVTQGYAPLIAPQATEFDAFTLHGSDVRQLLRLIARDGSAWMAHYTLRQMPDGDWRISGCYLEKLPGGAV